MIKECKYTQSLSNIKMSVEAKTTILQNLYARQKELSDKKTKSDNVVQKTYTQQNTRRFVLPKSKKLWVALSSCVSVVLILVIVLSIVFNSGGGREIPQAIVIESPIQNGERIDMTTKVMNAQYLPDIHQLASDSTSSLAMASNDNANKCYEIENNVFELQDGSLELNTEDYEQIIQNIGALNSTSRYKDSMSIEDIKDEALFMLKIIPGYNQWFKMPYSMPYIQDADKYSNNYYYLSYDKTNQHISMTRVRSDYFTDTYDSSTRKLYVWDSKAINYFREVIQVDYYTNTEGKEVVECQCIKFVRLKDDYYPISLQVIKNTENSSASKLSVFFTISNDLREYYYLDEEKNYYVREVVDIQDISEYGMVIKYFEMDYSKEDDVSMLKIDRAYPSLYLSNTKYTNLAYYRRSGENVMYFTEAWDYFNPYETPSKDTSLRNCYRVSGSWDENDNIYYKEENIKKSIVYDASEYTLKDIACDDCISDNFAGSDFIKECHHIQPSENISRKSSMLFVNQNSIYKDNELVKKEIAKTLENLNKNLNNTDAACSVAGSLEDFVFETEINRFTQKLSDSYIDNIYDFDKTVEIEKQAQKECTVISDEEMKEILQNAILCILEQESNSYAKDGVFYYDFSITLNDEELDEDKDYYLAVFLGSPIKWSGKYIVFDQKKIDGKGERKYSLKGQIDYKTILDTVLANLKDDTGYSSYLSTGIISYDEEGNMVKETASTYIEADGDNALYTERLGKLVYTARTTSVLNFCIRESFFNI